MESSILGPATIAFGAIIAALIAGCFSYINLINAKEQKISEFRQAWIDALRTSVSKYVSSLSYLSVLYKHYSDGEKKDKSKFEMAKGVNEVYENVNSAYNDIVFRVNNAESEPDFESINKAFLECLNASRNLYNKGEYNEAIKACDGVREATKPLLKNEWNRVKMGEPAYTKAKTIAVRILYSGMLLAIVDFTFITYTTFNSESHKSITSSCTVDTQIDKHKQLP
jgi:hypothetical protein